MNLNMNKTDDLNDKMVEYMNNKYDDTFTFNAPFGGAPGAKSKQITVKSEKYPDCEIWVMYYSDGETESFADNYVDYKFEEQTQERLVRIAKEIFSTDVIVEYYIPSIGVKSSYDDNTTFEEYIRCEEYPLTFSVMVSPDFSAENKDEVEKLLKNSFNKYDMNVISDFYFLKSKDNFNDIVENSQVKIKDSVKLHFTKTNDGEITCEWS